VAYIGNEYLGGINGSALFDAFDPLLVDLHDSLHKYRSDRKDKQYLDKLMHDVAAILDARLSDNEKVMASDILINLIKQVGTDIRKSLSERLAPRDDLHDTLLHYLAYDDIDVAEHVLQFSPLLKDIDLMFIIQSKAEDHGRAIAKRANIGERVISALVDKKDVLISKNLIQNPSLTLDENHLKAIQSIAVCYEELAHELVHYHGLPDSIATDLYWHVSAALRSNISKKFILNDDVLDRALEDCVQDFSDTILEDATMTPSTLMHEVSGMYYSQNKIGENMLVDTLRRRQGRFFIAMFSMKTGLKNKVVWSMMKQVGGQGLAVACRAIGISKESFVSMFLLSRTIARSNQAVTADELKMAMRYFDGLTFKMAKDILKDSIAG